MTQLWVQSLCQIKTASALISILLVTNCLLDEVHSQVVADQTLGNKNSLVTEFNLKLLNVYQIERGIKKGTTLFHSFKQFFLHSGSVAFFNNAGSIQNVISRVISSSNSIINGEIFTKSSANLLLMNPNCDIGK